MKHIHLLRETGIDGTRSSAVETPKETPESSAKVETKEVVKQTGSKLDVLKDIIASDAAMRVALSQADASLLSLVKAKVPAEKQDSAIKELAPLLERLNKITMWFRLKTFKTSVLEKVSAWTGGERPTGKLAEGVQKASGLLGSLEWVGDALTSVGAVTSQFENLGAMFGGWEAEDPTVSGVKMQIAEIQGKLETYKAQPGATPAWYRTELLAQLNNLIVTWYQWTPIVPGISWWTENVEWSSDTPSTVTSGETPASTNTEQNAETETWYEDTEYEETVVDQNRKKEY
jgi:hypothetical protein